MDNADDGPQGLSVDVEGGRSTGLRPDTGMGGHLIITSRYQEWPQENSLPLDTFTPKQSQAFLGKRTKLDDAAGAADLADKLGHLPLALEQAGAYIANMLKPSFSDYLAQWQAKEKKLDLLETNKPLKEHYPRSVATTWGISLDILKENNPAAVSLICLLAYYDPDDVPLSFIVQGLEAMDLAENDLNLPRNKEAVEEALTGLRDYSLVNYDPEREMISIHRLVQEVVRHCLDTDEEKKWALSATALTATQFRDDENPESWYASRPLAPHVLMLLGHTERLELPVQPVAGLFNDLGYHHLRLALFATAHNVFERMVTLKEKTYGEESAEVAITLGNLGSVYQKQGAFDKGQEVLERAVKIKEKAHGPNHPEVAITLGNLGLTSENLGDIPTAIKQMTRARDIFKATLPPDHPHTQFAEETLERLQNR